LASKAAFNRAAARPDDDARAPVPATALTCVPWRGIEVEVAAWDRLAATAGEPNPFFESWYLLPSLRAFDPAGDVHLLRFETDGRLSGLMPIIRQRRYYRWPIPNLSNWLHDNCFLGAPLVARGMERAFWRSLLEWADAHASAALFLHLRQMPLAGVLHEALQAVLATEGRMGALVHREERAMLRSELAPDAYLEAALSGKKRKELRRQFARLAEAGAPAFERRDDGAGLEQWIERFLALEAAGWKGKAASALACGVETADLFRESLHGAAARGRLERLTLTLDGRPIAMLATFLTPPGAYSFKTTFDERYARFSPGVLLQRENLAMLEQDGIAWSDSCAAADHPMIDHLWRERRAIGHLSIAIGGRFRRAIFGRLAHAELARMREGGGA
jgi:CelD/BcsL family acetyltransferase involved in cellulose biosynthesis